MCVYEQTVVHMAVIKEFGLKCIFEITLLVIHVWYCCGTILLRGQIITARTGYRKQSKVS